MKKTASIIAMIVRYLTALMMLVFGINKLFPFMPTPEMPGPMGDFSTALAKTGYFMPFVGLCMVIIGLMLLFNIHAALATVMLVPISLNIVLIHAFLEPASGVMGVVLLIFNMILIARYMHHYTPMLSSACCGK